MTTTTDLAIVGGGPAGLTCALTARAMNLDVTIIDALGLGGQLLNLDGLTLPGHQDHVTGPDLAATLVEQVLDAGAKVHIGNVADVAATGDRWELKGHGFEAMAGAVVIATGATPAPLDVPGERTLNGRGLSTCAACDGPLHAGRSVVVVGGGERALHEAVHLATLASSVCLLAPTASSLPRRVRERMLGTGSIIEMREVAEVTRIVGEDAVTGIEYIDERGGPGAVAASAVFVADRWEPASELVQALVDTADDGHVVVDGRLQAARPGLFAAGDVRAGSPQTILAAMTDGELAAASVVGHLSGDV